MNYYIDFDNTLYETSSLTSLMLEAIIDFVVENINRNREEISEEIKSNFNSTTGNIYKFAEEVAKGYQINPQLAVQNVKECIANSKNLTYEDGKRFLERIKARGHKLIMLTYIPDKSNEEYQMDKINASGLKDYFDEIIITSDYKFTLNLDYKKGIFVDDNPRDIKGLYEKSPIKVIRIKKKSNKYSKVDIDIKDIEEYESFDDIKIPLSREQEEVR